MAVPTQKQQTAIQALRDAIGSASGGVCGDKEACNNIQEALEKLMSCHGWKTVSWNLICENVNNEVISSVDVATVMGATGRSFEIAGNWHERGWEMVCLHESEAGDEVDRIAIVDAIKNHRIGMYTEDKLGIARHSLGDVAEAIELIAKHTGNPGQIVCQKTKKKSRRRRTFGQTKRVAM